MTDARVSAIRANNQLFMYHSSGKQCSTVANVRRSGVIIAALDANAVVSSSSPARGYVARAASPWRQAPLSYRRQWRLVTNVTLNANNGLLVTCCDMFVAVKWRR